MLRETDFFARVGGEAFGIILVEVVAPGGPGRVRAAPRGRGRARRAGRNPVVSAGAAELRDDEDAASLYRRADEALLRAKASGKGTLVSAGTPVP